LGIASSLDVEIGSRKENNHKEQTKTQNQSLDLCDLTNGADHFEVVAEEWQGLQWRQHDLGGMGGVFG
jgi:hypothetical protein